MADDAFAKLLYDQVLNDIAAGLPVSDEQWSYLELFDFVTEGIAPTMDLPLEDNPAVQEIGSGLLPKEYDRALGKLRREEYISRRSSAVDYPLREISW